MATAATINQDIRFLCQCDSPVVFVLFSVFGLFVLMLAPNKCAKTKESKQGCKEMVQKRVHCCNSVQTNTVPHGVADVPFPKCPFASNIDALTVYRHYLLIFGHDSCTYWNLFYCQHCCLLAVCMPTSGQSTSREHQLNWHLSLLAPRWLFSSFGTVGLSLSLCLQLGFISVFMWNCLVCPCLSGRCCANLFGCTILRLRAYSFLYSSIYYYCALIIRQSVLIRFNLNLYPHTSNIASSAPHSALPSVLWRRTHLIYFLLFAASKCKQVICLWHAISLLFTLFYLSLLSTTIFPNVCWSQFHC